MTDGKSLREKIDSLGMKIVHLCEVTGIERGRMYRILGGDDCTASEITAISNAIRLTKAERDRIFFFSKK